MKDKSEIAFFWLSIFALVALFLYIVLIGDRANAQENILVEEQKPSSSIVVIVPKTEQELFFELSDQEQFEKAITIKEASDNLASKYAKLYDSCRFSTGYINSKN